MRLLCGHGPGVEMSIGRPRSTSSHGCTLRYITMVNVRPQLPSPDEDCAAIKRIEFRHPAYPDSAPALLRLSAVDDGGIDFDTAFLACCVITGNTWSSAWLAQRGREGRLQRLARPLDGILRDSVYHFCVGEDVHGSKTWATLECLMIAHALRCREIPGDSILRSLAISPQ